MLLAMLGWLLFANQAIARECLPVAQDMQRVNVLPHTEHYADVEGTTPLPNAAQQRSLKQYFSGVAFQPVQVPGEEYVLGASGVNHWLRFCLQNPTQDELDFVMVITPPITHQIDFYPQQAGSPSFQTGYRMPFATRDIHSPEFHFQAGLAAGETQDYYLRIQTLSEAYITLDLWGQKNYLVVKDRSEALDGVIVGVLLGLILYNLLMFASVRHASSFWYIAWASSTLVILALFDGRVLQYVFPKSPHIVAYLTTVWYPLAITVSACFSREFIRLKRYPKLDLVGKLLIGLSLLALLLIYPFDKQQYLFICAMYMLSVILYFGFIAPLYGLIKHNSTQAKYLLGSQLPLMICFIDRSLLNLGLSDQHYIPYTPKVGLVVEMVLLGYFVGRSIHKDKEAAQAVAMEQLEISNELKSNYNTQLEDEIERKTADIQSMNASLEQQAKKLIEMDQAKSDFFANVSHEFRTPLTLIQGPLNQLLEQSGSGEKSLVRGAIRHSKDLQQLIDQLLTLSKFDSKSLNLKASELDVTELLRNFTSQFDSLAQKHNITLRFDTELESLRAYVDANKLQVVINNLLKNAIKFTPAGGEVVVAVSVEHAEPIVEADFGTDQYFNITVTDTGCGIEQDELPYVFDRFYQARGADKSSSGTGIGLALVKELVNLHAGDVKVESHRANKKKPTTAKVSGTRFEISLPLGKAHLTPAEIELTQAPALDLDNGVDNTPEHSAANSNGELSESGKTVLIVDDNTDMRDYLRSLLDKEFHVVEAENGLVGEEKALQSKPDLIVTDLMMPERDGLEFVAALKQQEALARIPIIMLTARAGLDDKIKGLLAAVDDYLAKPFDALELKVRVRNLLQKQQQFEAFYAAENEGDINGNADAELKPEPRLLTKLRDIVYAELRNESFGVAELAAAVHTSKSTLRRQLAEISSFTPSEFIRHCRLERARQISNQGEARTIAQLAHAVGFNQPTYFSKLYQKTFNQPPLATGVDSSQG